MFGRIGPWELILVLLIALVIFGPSKLPEIGKSLGRAFTEFKSSLNDGSSPEKGKDTNKDNEG